LHILKNLKNREKGVTRIPFKMATKGADSAWQGEKIDSDAVFKKVLIRKKVSRGMKGGKIRLGADEWGVS